VRGNAEAPVTAKDKAVSRFLGYLDEMGVGDLAALGVRDVSGFLLRQRGLRRKTIAGMRSSLADFLAFLAAAGCTPQSLAGRLPPRRRSCAWPTSTGPGSCGSWTGWRPSGTARPPPATSAWR
jgi:site-specific recombinase XerD